MDSDAETDIDEDVDKDMNLDKDRVSIGFLERLRAKRASTHWDS